MFFWLVLLGLSMLMWKDKISILLLIELALSGVDCDCFLKQHKLNGVLWLSYQPVQPFQNHIQNEIR